MKFFTLFAIFLCVYGSEVKEKENTETSVQDKEKRQTEGEGVAEHYVYRTARKQEPVTPVEEQQDEDKPILGQLDNEEYRPGKVISLNVRELLELQPERKAPVSSNQHLQYLYNEPRQEHKQNLQPFYFLEQQQVQNGRQVSLQPSHAVITRPRYSADGGEASVGAALSVSDNSAAARPSSDSFDQELLELIRSNQAREESRAAYPVREDNRQSYSPQPQAEQGGIQSIASQYQQIEKYLTKPNKKPSKMHTKVQLRPHQSSAAPQQYLIETTNVQQAQEPQVLQQYRLTSPQQRTGQVLRYVQEVQTPAYFESSEPQGLKVVAAPKLDQQQPRSEQSYRFISQYQSVATPKLYNVADPPRLQARIEQGRPNPSNHERPVSYLKRFPEPETMRSVNYYDQSKPESGPQIQHSPQIIGEQYYLRPVYRSEKRPRYELPTPIALEQERYTSPTKPPTSAIFVAKNVAPKKLTRPQIQPYIREQAAIEQQRMEQVRAHHRMEQARDQHIMEQAREQHMMEKARELQRMEQAARFEQVSIQQHGHNIDDQRAQLPPPRNNKAYTPEEFEALVAAGYPVTPVPVNHLGQQTAQSRSSVEIIPQPFRRPLQNRRNQYLPLRGDDAP